MKRTYGPPRGLGVAKTLALAMILLTACDRSHVVDPDEMSIDGKISQISFLPEPAPPNVDTLSVQHGTKDEGGAEWGCMTVRIRRTENFDEMVSFNPNAEVLWPGAVVQGKDLDKGTPALIPLPRGPLTIFIDLPFTGSRIIAKPEVATAKAAIYDILQSIPPGTKTTANVSFDWAEAHSIEQSVMQLGISPRWLSGKARANIWSEHGYEKRSIMIKFIQAYYTLAINPPAQASQFFDASVTTADTRPYIYEGNPPAYISSVTYGRMFVLQMTSTRSYAEMKATAELAFSGVDLTGEMKRIFEESEIRGVIMGGSAEDAIEVFTKGRIKEYFEKGANFSPASPGVPIGYTVKYLRDHTVAKLGFSTEYVVEECSVNLQYFRVTMEKIDIVKACDNGASGGAGEFYYEFKIDGAVIALPEKNAVSRHDGQTIEINRAVTLSKFKRQDQPFTVSGWVKEKDTFGHDELRFPPHTYSYEDNKWNPGQKVEDIKKNDGCHVRVHYTIERL